jgi:hypothetical protein
MGYYALIHPLAPLDLFTVVYFNHLEVRIYRTPERFDTLHKRHLLDPSKIHPTLHPIGRILTQGKPERTTDLGYLYKISSNAHRPIVDFSPSEPAEITKSVNSPNRPKP